MAASISSAASLRKQILCSLLSQSIAFFSSSKEMKNYVIIDSPLKAATQEEGFVPFVARDLQQSDFMTFPFSYCGGTTWCVTFVASLSYFMALLRASVIDEDLIIIMPQITVKWGLSTCTDPHGWDR